MIGLALCTVNRPEYCEKAVKRYRKYLTGVVDHFVVINDGSDSRHNGAYRRVEKAVQSINGTYVGMDINNGVAVTKNIGIQSLISKGCDWIILAEDDILVTDERAVTGYIDAAVAVDMQHLSFAHHGPANVGYPLSDGPITYFPHAVGAWSLYSRECLEKVGVFDTNMLNAFEHVELSLRLALAGYTSGPYNWADATYSADWLTEIPGSIEHSSIRPRDDWSQNVRNSLRYWRDEKPDTFALMFGDNTPLQNWANSILG